MPQREQLPPGMIKRGNVYHASFMHEGVRIRRRLSTDLSLSVRMLELMQEEDNANWLADIARFKPSDGDGFVYFLHDIEKDWVRIGKSKNGDTVIARVRGEQCLISSETRLLAMMRGACNEEVIHRLLWRYKVPGRNHSWYLMHREVVRFISKHATSARGLDLFEMVMLLEDGDDRERAARVYDIMQAATERERQQP